MTWLPMASRKRRSAVQQSRRHRHRVRLRGVAVWARVARRLVAACQEAGFAPDTAFEDPPVNAMLARLSDEREVGLAPASFAEHAADLSSTLTVRDVVAPQIPADLSVLWSVTGHSPAVAGVLATARRCAERHSWLTRPTM